MCAGLWRSAGFWHSEWIDGALWSFQCIASVSSFFLMHSLSSHFILAFFHMNSSILFILLYLTTVIILYVCSLKIYQMAKKCKFVANKLFTGTKRLHENRKHFLKYTINCTGLIYYYQNIYWFHLGLFSVHVCTIDIYICFGHCWSI